MGKINDTQLKAMKPNGKIQKKSDGDGLYAFLGAKSKSISWQMAYRFDGKQKILSFGRYPEVSLAEARRKCFDARALLEARRDPTVVKRLEKEEAKAVELAESLTFESVAEQWFEKEYADSPPSTQKKSAGFSASFITI